jgi:transcriptional regulator with XRE-family HTH domain
MTARNEQAVKAAGLTQQELSEHFGVSRGNVSKIVNHRSYADA